MVPRPSARAGKGLAGGREIIEVKKDENGKPKEKNEQESFSVLVALSNLTTKTL